MYRVEYEETPNNWSAYVPELPGCVATGRTRDEVERNIREAIAMHVEPIWDSPSELIQKASTSPATIPTETESTFNFWGVSQASPGFSIEPERSGAASSAA